MKIHRLVAIAIYETMECRVAARIREDWHDEDTPIQKAPSDFEYDMKIADIKHKIKHSIVKISDVVFEDGNIYIIQGKVIGDPYEPSWSGEKKTHKIELSDPSAINKAASLLEEYHGDA